MGLLRRGGLPHQAVLRGGPRRLRQGQPRDGAHALLHGLPGPALPLQVGLCLILITLPPTYADPCNGTGRHPFITFANQIKLNQIKISQEHGTNFEADC